MILSNISNFDFLEEICNYCGFGQISYETIFFTHGEILLKIDKSANISNDIILFHGFDSGISVSDSVLQLIFILGILRNKNIRKIKLLIPYFPYSRFDKEEISGYTPLENIANILPYDIVQKIIVVDFHNLEAKKFFKCEFINFIPSEVFASDIKSRNFFNQDDTYVMALDQGSINRANFIAEILSLPVFYTEKTRDSISKDVKFKPLSTSVKGKKIIIVDDVVCTGKTLLSAVEMLKFAGASYITAYSSHFFLDDYGVNLIEKSDLDNFVFSNSTKIDINSKKISKIKIGKEIAALLKN